MSNRYIDHDNCGFGLIANIDNKPSHDILNRSLEALIRMTHRGAVAADGVSGDGCGISMRMPVDFFRKKAEECEIELTDSFATGLVFFSQDESRFEKEINILSDFLMAQRLSLDGIRDVPVDTSVLGQIALQRMPRIQQVYINKPDNLADIDFKKKLFIVRKLARKALISRRSFYCVSLSTDTIVFKGMLTPKQLGKFYLDLQDDGIKTSACLFHQRFSTNTNPKWRLAQPFRYLAHNGEINTIHGNRAWLNARVSMVNEMLNTTNDLTPFVSIEDSDSCSFDHILELLLLSQIKLPKAIRILNPPVWNKDPLMSDKHKSVYEYYDSMIEPWDGPAGMVMMDSEYIVCSVDKNGLRPTRWQVTKGNNLILGSEIGIYDASPDNVVSQGRVGAGEVLVLDINKSKLYNSHDYDDILANEFDYISENKKIKVIQNRSNTFTSELSESIDIMRKKFDLSYEIENKVILPLADNAQEAIGSMGDDIPIALLSKHNRSLYDCFRQKFSQVTNPPIDPIREYSVMHTYTYFGSQKSIFADPDSYDNNIIRVNSPVLTPCVYNQVIKKIKKVKNYTISLLYNPEIKDIKTALKDIANEACAAVSAGYSCLVLDDSINMPGKVVMHSLLAVGIIHNSLINAQIRSNSNIIVKSANIFDSHHVACIIGAGATAVYPYLSYALIDSKYKDSYDHISNYATGLHKGLLKILSKMGISTLSSYRGSNTVETLGLDREIIDLCFPDIENQLTGISFTDIENHAISLTKNAYSTNSNIRRGGIYQYDFYDEYHAINPGVVTTLHKALRSRNYDDYLQYASLVNNRPISFIRDNFILNPKSSIDINEVEGVDEIFPRFCTAAMSLGAISKEAHETLAIAMNELGGFSNSGEGGEDPSRYNDSRKSRIKQIASGRFGVTSDYLVNADILQIKICQGAKPGEGGQLPADKVSDLIAELRYTKKGVPLISPPPHHDIYSIEDLAQLIYDLKAVNPDAKVAVKLASESGIGTIAAGVVKAGADIITIAGNDGGTGASPLTSLRYAGTPWEIGLNEVHTTLKLNGFRDKVQLEVDGGLKTGYDIVKASILGADRFGFGTMPLIAMGCKYLKICHLNNCATGVATQNQKLRDKHFSGDVQKVKDYFQFIAREIRETLASIGVTSLAKATGRKKLLKMHPEAKNNTKIDEIIKYRIETNYKNNILTEQTLNDKILSKLKSSIDSKQACEYSIDICNTDRSFGAGISGYVAKKFSCHKYATPWIKVKLKGYAGQSLGVWNHSSLHIDLDGSANDYVGKGMSGGVISISSDKLDTDMKILAGNTCLYGATSGYLFISGGAGERFAVRNSGAVAVVSSIGKHGCEYMTGGVVVVLGKIGYNFGAGMTGGIAFVKRQEHLKTKLSDDVIVLDNTNEFDTYLSKVKDKYSRYISDDISIDDMCCIVPNSFAHSEALDSLVGV